jgi:hypothetical protein
VVEGVNNRDDLGVLGETLLLLLRHQCPELVNVDRRLPELVAGNVEVPHTNLSKVARVVLVKVGTKREHHAIRNLAYRDRQSNIPVVVLTTSETTTPGVLAVLADTSVAGRDVAAVLASVAETGRHFLERKTAEVSPESSKSLIREATTDPSSRTVIPT